MTEIELAGARLTQAQLAQARLNRVNLAGADLTDADLTGARLVEVDLTDAMLAGSRWSRAAILSAAATPTTGNGELDPAAVAGRDPAEPMLRASGSVQAMVGVAGLDLLAVARGQSVELVDPTSRQVIRLLTGHTGSVWAVAAVPLPDGRTILATASDDRTVRLWDPTTGTTLGNPLTGHTSPVLAVAAVPLPDGRTILATASDDRTVRLWDPTTGTTLGNPLTGHTSPVLAVAAVPLPDGRTILATASDDRTVRLWLLTTGSSHRTAPALQPAGGAGTRKRRGVFRATLAAFGVDDSSLPPVAAVEPQTYAVPEIHTQQVATLVASDSGWATLLQDGLSYKSAGDVSDLLWWAIKLCRFEAGELDPYDPAIRHLPHEE